MIDQEKRAEIFALLNRINSGAVLARAGVNLTTEEMYENGTPTVDDTSEYITLLEGVRNELTKVKSEVETLIDLLGDTI